MLFSMPYTKNVVIKNMTGDELKDFYLIYEGLEKHPYKISTIAPNRQQTIDLVLLYLTNPTDLILMYNRNGDKKEIVVCGNLWKDDLRDLILNISKKDNEIHVESIINEV